METYLENISKNSNPKDNFYIVNRATTSQIKTKFATPLNGKGYEIALTGLSTYYSFPNIDEKNNTIIIASKETEHEIKLPKGCYELFEVNNNISAAMGWTKDAEITITADDVTLRSKLCIQVPKWRVIFPEEHSLGLALGFDPGTYHYKKDTFGHAGCYISQKIVNILKVNTIMIHADIVSGSMVDGAIKPVIFNVSPNVSPGNKIVVEPVNPIYLPVNRDVINEVNIWLTDQDNEILDLQGEKIVVTLHMRER
jgi:hypothetical protein